MPKNLPRSENSLLLDNPSDKDTSWVIDKIEKRGGYNFFSHKRVIKAPVQLVWEVAKNVGQYEEYSNGAIKAHVEPELSVGSTIGLDLYTKSTLGKFIPHSDETVTIVNEANHVLGWERKLPLTKNPTERYGIFQSSYDNPNETIVYTGLHIPGFVGGLTKFFLGKKIESAFDKLNDGIKQEAERRASIK